jgi:hypothetical protein
MPPLLFLSKYKNNAMSETFSETRNVRKLLVKSKQKRTTARRRHERKVKVKINVK